MARVRTAKTTTGAKIVGGPASSRRAADGAHFTHFDASGQAHMVDVAGKDVTRRVARAGGRIAMQPATLALIRSGDAKKGDVLRRRADRGDHRRQAHGRPHPAVPSAAADARRRRLCARRRALRGRDRSDRRNAWPHRRRDGGADRRGRRASHHLRHVQGRRPRHAHRGDAASRKGGRQVRAFQSEVTVAGLPAGMSCAMAHAVRRHSLVRWLDHLTKPPRTRVQSRQSSRVPRSHAGRGRRGRGRRRSARVAQSHGGASPCRCTRSNRCGSTGRSPARSPR